MSSNNLKRIESDILIVLNNTLKKEINSKILRFVCFTYVKLSPALDTAHIYVDYFKSQYLDQIIEELKKAKGVFRSAIAKKLNLRKTPDLIFEKDQTILDSIKIDAILNKINK